MQEAPVETLYASNFCISTNSRNKRLILQKLCKTLAKKDLHYDITLREFYKQNKNCDV